MAQNDLKLLKKWHKKVFKLLRIKSSSSHLSRVAPNFFLATRKKSFVTEGLQPQANNISFFLCHKFYTHHPQLSLFNAHFSLSIGSKLGLKRNLERDLHHFQGLFILLALILWDIQDMHSVWKLPKMSHLRFSIFAFSTHSCLFKIDLFGNNVWLHCWMRLFLWFTNTLQV